ncbi:anti-sigma factor domain-containing protein [Nocardia sp. NPDC020380]|uniref:anti-sigma factor n=1 Tax=Nocardia sp. NPDC020380 TaxID=3364309 RepID=UPI0037BBFA58
MPDIHPHTDLPDLAYPYALDALSDQDRRAVEHLLTQADEPTATAFRTTVHDLRETLAALTVVDKVPAPPTLEAKLDSAITAQSRPAPRGANRSRRWLAAAAAAAILAGAGAGIAIYHNQSHPTGITAEQVLKNADATESTTPLTGGGTITVHTSHQLDATVITFTALPQPPTAHTYQLWLIPPNGTPKPAGLLTTIPTPTTPLLLRVGNAHQLALSVEPTGGSPAPTTTPLVAVPLT